MKLWGYCLSLAAGTPVSLLTCNTLASLENCGFFIVTFCLAWQILHTQKVPQTLHCITSVCNSVQLPAQHSYDHIQTVRRHFVDKLSHRYFLNDKLSQMTKCPNLCTYAQESYGKLLGHFVASEKGYWDNLSQVKKATLGHCANFAQGIDLQINKVGQPTKCPNNFP